MQTRRRQALGDRAWRRARLGPRVDLASGHPATSAAMSTRRRAAISATTSRRADEARGGRSATVMPVRSRTAPRWLPRACRLGGPSLGAQALEELGGQPGVDGQGSPFDPLLELADDARHEQRRAGVEEDDVAPAAGLAAQHGLAQPRVLVGGPAGQPRGRRPLEPERGGIDDMTLDRVTGHDVRDAAAVERELVDARRHG